MPTRNTNKNQPPSAYIAMSPLLRLGEGGVALSCPRHCLIFVRSGRAGVVITVTPSCVSGDIYLSSDLSQVRGGRRKWRGEDMRKERQYGSAIYAWKFVFAIDK